MKQNMILLPAIAASAIVFGACSGKSKTTSESDIKGVDITTAEDSIATQPQRLVTDSVHFADSLVLGGCKATASVAGLYPVKGGKTLLDSLHYWLGEQMSTDMQNSTKKLFKPTADELADGQELAKGFVSASLRQALQDFTGFVADSVSTTYEYNCNFSPAFESDSLTTYSMGTYVYFGGAHGGVYGISQTFVNSTGEQLTANKVFSQDNRPKLIDLLRRELWSQYFKAESPEGSTLRDALLIDPDTLPLPATPPAFLADGVAFTYQQYEIACYAAGMPSCIIPYSTIRPLVRPQIQPLLP